MSTIRIERVTSGEVEVLLDLARRTFDESYRSLNDTDDFESYLASSFTWENFETQLSNPQSRFYFAFDDDELAGYFKVNTGSAQTESFDPDAMEIERIYVDQRFQGAGIGRVMIISAETLAREAGITTLWLGVWEKNPGAIEFYQKVGFEAFSKHIFRIGNDDQTDILMRKNIRP